VIIGRRNEMQCVKKSFSGGGNGTEYGSRDLDNTPAGLARGRGIDGTA